MKSSVFANNIHWQVLYIALEIHPGPLLPAAGHGSFSSIFCFFCGVSFTSFRHLSIATMWWKPSRFIRYTYYLHSDITNPLKKTIRKEIELLALFFFWNFHAQVTFDWSSHLTAVPSIEWPLRDRRAHFIILDPSSTFLFQFSHFYCNSFGFF
jgi:hypothetical protein